MNRKNATTKNRKNTKILIPRNDTSSFFLLLLFLLAPEIKNLTETQPKG
jgi:hypothetical protein